MLEKTNLEKIILYDLSALYETIFNKLKTEALVLLPAVILIASVLTFLFGMDFGGVIKRAFLGVMAIILFSWFFVGAANVGLQVGDKILSKDNYVLKSLGEATVNIFTPWNYSENLNMGLGWFEEKTQGVISYLIWVLSNFALWFIKITFTIAYYLPLITIPVVAIINIFPITAKSLEGALFTCIWIAITPIVIAVLLELINGILGTDAMISAHWLSKTLMSFLFALYLIGSFSLSSKMIGQSGISEGITPVGQNFGMGLAMTLQSYATSPVRGIVKFAKVNSKSGAKYLMRMPLKHGKEFKENRYYYADRIINSNAQTAEQIVNEERIERSEKEEKALNSNKFWNHFKARRDGKDRKAAAMAAIAEGKKDKLITRTEVNKYREDQGKKPISKWGKTYTPSKKEVVYMRYKDTRYQKSNSKTSNNNERVNNHINQKSNSNISNSNGKVANHTNQANKASLAKTNTPTKAPKNKEMRRIERKTEENRSGTREHRQTT